MSSTSWESVLRRGDVAIGLAKIRASFPKIQIALPAWFFPPEGYVVTRAKTGEELHHERSCTRAVQCVCARTLGWGCVNEWFLMGYLVGIVSPLEDNCHNVMSFSQLAWQQKAEIYARRDALCAPRGSADAFRVRVWGVCNYIFSQIPTFLPSICGSTAQKHCIFSYLLRVTINKTSLIE